MLRSSRTNRGALVMILGALAAAPGLVLPHARASADGATLAPALKAIQGTWVSERNGYVDAKWTIDGDSVKAEVDGVEYVGKLEVDDQAKPHPSLTVNVKQGASDAKGQSYKGIYKLDGGKLTVNIAFPGVDRPKDFEPGGDQSHLFELAKAKPKAK